MQGWISLHRKLMEWEWYTDANTFRLFMHCLLSANHKDGKWRGIEVKSGSFVTSNDKLALKLGLTVQNIRTSIKKLKSTNEITIKTTNKNTCISLVNWELYQNKENINNQINNETNKQLTNNQQTTNKQLTTNNNDNNINNENKESKEDFLKSLEKPISDEETLKMEKAINFIKDGFNYSNENEIKSFLSKLKKENDLSNFGKQTKNYFKFLELSKTDVKFKKSFKTWRNEWSDEDWSSKTKNLESVKTELTPTQLKNKSKERKLRESRTF